MGTTTTWTTTAARRKDTKAIRSEDAHTRTRYIIRHHCVFVRPSPSVRPSCVPRRLSFVLRGLSFVVHLSSFFVRDPSFIFVVRWPTHRNKPSQAKPNQTEPSPSQPRKSSASQPASQPASQRVDDWATTFQQSLTVSVTDWLTGCRGKFDSE